MKDIKIIQYKNKFGYTTIQLQIYFSGFIGLIKI